MALPPVGRGPTWVDAIEAEVVWFSEGDIDLERVGEQAPLQFVLLLFSVANPGGGNRENQAMEMIQSAEWAVLAILAAGFLISLYLIVSVQGDLRLREESGLNTDEQATAMFIGLLNQTRRRIDIHDDGNDFADSMYNSPEVIDALRERIRKRNIKVRCLFNDADQPLELLELARSEEFRNRIEIWYLNGGRQEPDTHYKIVDSGRLVHLSRHEHGASERGYRLRKALRWWEVRTRHRISKQYRDHFEHGLKNAVQGRVVHAGADRSSHPGAARGTVVCRRRHLRGDRRHDRGRCSGQGTAATQ